ncbi:SPOC like C-terminal domain-containing protein [Mycotypha africana]|uniref:SPOC like C-terminal domain-containing protein n=1 Tax=Mycotypha africana TaxID=64632 RepID=UPI0023006D3C|nr:SPOC like C-terminal domain-containing protein [Mycotypha africana]KAI8967494.1 SPOC like C-terminal domain-containing protein [Mycotypha africana]
MDMVSVLLAGTPETNNILNDDTPDQYEHIFTLSGISQPNLKLLRKLQTVSTSKETDPPADVLDAVIVAIQMIVDHCRKLKYQKRIVLFTNAEQPIDWDDMDAVGEMMEANDISLIVVGSDYEPYENADADNCTDVMKTNYENWNTLTKRTPEGEVLSLAQAYEDSQADYAKEVRPTPSYRGFLYLGDPVGPHSQADDEDDASQMTDSTLNHFLAIPIFTYLRTKPVPLPSFKKYATNDDTRMDVDSATDGTSHKVTYETKLTIEDTKLDEDGNELDTEEIEITKDQVDKAFRFGKTAVKISEEELQLEKQKMTTRKQMSILRFIPKKEFPRSFLCSHASVIMPGAYSTDAANLALRALAYAMSEEKVIALVRYVYTDGAAPMLGILDPAFIVGTDEVPETFILHYFETTFAEDIRDYVFLRLNMKDVEQTLEDQMDSLIDAMELDSIDESYLMPETVYNGLIWRVHKAIKTRALNREAPIPDIKDSAKPAFQLHKKFIEKASEISQHIANTVKVREVKKKGKKRSRDAEEAEQDFAAESGNIDELLDKTAAAGAFGGSSLTGITAGSHLSGQPSGSIATDNGLSGMSGDSSTSMMDNKAERVGLNHPVEDFKSLLNRSSDVDMVIPAMKQMIEAIHELLKISFGNQNYRKVIKCLKALKETAMAEEEAVLYNTHVRELKQWCDLPDKFSPHRELWEMMKKNNLGLLTNKDTTDTDIANITQEMAEEFWNETDLKEQVQKKKEDEDLVEFEEDLDDLI